MAGLRKSKVGIVGLGIMGGAFARNLLRAGWEVIGYDTAPARRRAFVNSGVKVAADIASLAAAAPTLVTSLPNPRALHETVAAVIAAQVKPRVVVETSTFALTDKLAAETTLREAGHLALDCPVSGTGAQAKLGDLVVYASGDAKAIARLRPLFLGISREVHDLGAFGNGSRMKYVANLLVAIHNVASAEAMVLGIKAGLDPAVVFELIRAGSGNSRIFELRAPMMVAGNYAPPTMAIETWRKDLDVIGAYAAELGAPAPLFSASLPIYAAAKSMGFGHLDTASVCAVLETMGKVIRTGGKRKPRMLSHKTKKSSSQKPQESRQRPKSK